MLDLWVRVLQHNGGSPFYARNQRQLLVEAGFERVTASASPVTYGRLENTRWNADGTKNIFLGLARTALREGWVDQAAVDAICDDLTAWGESEGSFGLTLWFSAVGWVPD